MKTLTPEATAVVRAMEEGKLLRIERGVLGGRLVGPPARPQSLGEVAEYGAKNIKTTRAVSSRAIFELQQAGLITRLKPDNRLGLRDLGIDDFLDAEYWCLTQ